MTKEYKSYKDWLAANRKSADWKVETTPKLPGHFVATGTDIVRHP